MFSPILNFSRVVGRQFVTRKISHTCFLEGGKNRREASQQVVFGESEEDVFQRQGSLLRKKGGKLEVFSDTSDEENEYLDDYEPDCLALEGYVDSDEIVISSMPEETKREIFNLHEMEPTRWTALELSRRFNMTVNRVKSVIYLLRKREEAIEKLIPPAQSRKESWVEIYEKYVADPEGNSIENLSAEAKLSTGQVEDIIIRMKQYKYRAANLTAAIDHSNYQLQFFNALGVNTSFSESKPDDKLQKNYFPDLFRDDSFDIVQDDLKEMILDLTKAQPVTELASYLTSSEQRRKMSKTINELNSRQEKLYSIGNTCKFNSKFAFRDLSSECNGPTVIRMRNGRFRLATPLEEMKRSWNKLPSALDIAHHEKLLLQVGGNDIDEQ